MAPAVKSPECLAPVDVAMPRRGASTDDGERAKGWMGLIQMLLAGVTQNRELDQAVRGGVRR